MTDDASIENDEPNVDDGGAVGAERTGHPVVDGVLDSLRELDDVPVSERVAVFEAAHERLRGALSDAGDPPPDA